jgi:hypothetical protein
MDEPACDPFPRASEPDPVERNARQQRLQALREQREAARAFPNDALILGLQPALPRALRRPSADEQEQDGH